MPSYRGLFGQLAGIDLEGGARARAAQVAPVARVADQRLVALLQLTPEPVDDGVPVGTVLLGFPLRCGRRYGGRRPP